MLIPYHQLVIITSTCQLLVVKRPLQPTDLLFMSRKPRKVLIRRSQIPAENLPVSRPRAHKRPIPGYRADAPLMARQRPHKLLVIDVIDLSLAHERAYREVGAPLVPVNTGNAVALVHFAEVGDLLRCC